jgi:ferredoxin
MPGGVIEVRRRRPSGWLGWLGVLAVVRAGRIAARRRRSGAGRLGEPVPGAAPVRRVPVLVDGPDGAPLCVACGLCAFVCPTACLTVVPGERPGAPASRMPERFDLDWGRCLRCGLCEDACPERAIVLAPGTARPGVPGRIGADEALSRDDLRVPGWRLGPGPGEASGGMPT